MIMLRSRRHRTRLSTIQQHVLIAIRQRPIISYEELCAQLDIDRSTAVAAVRRLELQHRVVKLTGSGRNPNRYLLTDRLLQH